MILYDNAREERTSRAVVMFPTRYETGISDDAQATDYSTNFDVYKVTLGGYPKQDGPDRSVETTESTCIQDANAAISVLKQLGYKKIAVHGAGLGCVPALAAAELHPDVVKAVVLDRGFTRAKDVLANAVRNRLQPLGLGKWVPTSIFRGMVGAAFPYGMQVAGISGVTTNQMDNLDRIQQVGAPIGCIEATQDFWMSRSLLPEPDNLESFSQDLLRAHGGENDAIQTLQGGHHKALEQGVLVEWLNRVMPIDLEGGKKEPVEHKASKGSVKKSPKKPAKNKVVAPQNQKSQLVPVEELFLSLPVSHGSSSSSSSSTTLVATTVSSESSSSVASSSSSSMSSASTESNPWSTLPPLSSESVLSVSDGLFSSLPSSILSDT